MRSLFVCIGVLALAGSAFAGNPPIENVPAQTSVSCNLQYVAYDWDFAAGDQGFAPTTCDPTGGNPIWAYGTESTIPGAPGNVWGTVLNANYPNDAGEGLVSPPFMVAADAHLMEILHYFRCETNYDGGNVSVDGTVIPPTDGYSVAAISTSTSFYAWCVDMEPGFSGSTAENWVYRCFDLSGYMGQTIQVEFDFGSDSSVSYPGWYLAYVKVGTDQAVPVEPSTWGNIKDLYN